MPGSMDESRTGIMVTPKIVPKIVMFNKGDYATIESCYTGEVDLWCRYTRANDEDDKKAIDLSKKVKKDIDYSGSQYSRNLSEYSPIKRLKKVAPPKEVAQTSRLLLQAIADMMKRDSNGYLSKKIVEELARMRLDRDELLTEIQKFPGLSNQEIAVIMLKTGKSLSQALSFTHLFSRDVVRELYEGDQSLDEIIGLTGLSSGEILIDLVRNGECLRDCKYLDGIIAWAGLAKEKAIMEMSKAAYSQQEDLWELMYFTELSIEEIAVNLFKEGIHIDTIKTFTELSKEKIFAKLLREGQSLSEIISWSRLSEEKIITTLYQADLSLEDIINLTSLSKQKITMDILKVLNESGNKFDKEKISSETF